MEDKEDIQSLTASFNRLSKRADPFNRALMLIEVLKLIHGLQDAALN